MSHKVFVHADSDFPDLTETLDAACRATLAHEDAAPGEISIVLVDEERMRQFNLRFADEDTPTDVLAFSDGSIDPDSESTYHGDIIVCYPIAELQASRNGNSTADELSLLTIHGVLHLLGYDHKTEEAQTAMWTVQNIVLKKLGAKSPPRRDRD